MKGQVIDNPTFEENPSCDVNDASNQSLSCIDGWWPYYSDQPDVAWHKYGSIPGILGICQGVRGGLFGGNDKEFNFIATRNPYYQTNTSNSGIILKLTGFDADVLHSFPAYVHVAGSTVPNEILSAGTPAYKVLGRTNTVLSEMCKSYIVKFGVNYSYDNNIYNLSDYPYLVFIASTRDVITGFTDPPVEAKPLVCIDEVSTCETVKVSYEVTNCNSLDINISYNPSCLDLGCYPLTFGREGEESPCTFQLFVDGVEEETNDVLYPGIYSYGGLSPGIHSFEVIITHKDENGNIDFEYYGPGQWNATTTSAAQSFYICPSSPAPLTITSNTVWSPGLIPNDGFMGNVTIASGYKLKIAPGTVVKFCPGTGLTVEPGARLDLYGTLTSSCPAGWEGVLVKGTSTSPQPTPSGLSVLTNQGSMFTYTGSIIENAKIGIRVGENSTTSGGGVVQCTETFFHNNSWGVIFNKYDYNSGGIHTPNKSFFDNCRFKTDIKYTIPGNFIGHAKLNSVDGILFSRCVFDNTQNLPVVYNHGIANRPGIGIVTYNSGFSVAKETTFTGLNSGIKIVGSAKHYPVNIDGAIFDKNYNGIENYFQAGIKVTGCTFRYNESIPSAFSEAQIGIYLSSTILGQKIDNNQFIKNGITVRPALGIVSSFVGTYNNIINNNYFRGLTLGNEGYGLNGGLIKGIPNGLQYQCNTNVEVISHDFFFPGQASVYSAHPNQNTIENVLGVPTVRSAGNGFSISLVTPGSTHDWRNDIGSSINYYYDNGVTPREEPLFFSGLTPIEIFAGACAGFALNPDKSLATLTSEFNAAKAQLIIKKDALGKEGNVTIREGIVDEASLYQSIMNQRGSQILSYYWKNSASTDSIRAWLLRVDDISGDIIAANILAYEGNVTAANATIEAAKVKYNADAATIIELNKLKTIYAMAGYTNPDLLSLGNKTTLRSYTSIYSAAGAIAKGLLCLSDEFFPLDYVLPDGTIETRSEEQAEDLSTIVVFPNPSTGVIKVNIPEDQYNNNCKVQMYDIIGNRVITQKLQSGVNEIDVTGRISTGILIYSITNVEGAVIKTGKLVITK